ncbi:MAG: helix-turn-helix transcriptional regulator [Clostridia bacterium]|nr:helix-turn-helix transcriptional regulator [Clostridia bacterium]
MIKFSRMFVYRYCDLRKIPYHKHDCLEVVYYEQGTGITNIDGKVYSYEPNTFTITPKETLMNEIHTDSTTPWCVLLDVGDFKLRTGIYKDTEDKKIFELIKKIRREHYGVHPLKQEALDALSSLLIIEISRIAEADYEAKNLFSKVIREIELNCLNEIDVNKLADMTYYSYDRFRHLFKQYYGLSPKKYIIKCRIEQAKRMLGDKTNTITYVSEVCQFVSYNQFRVLFKEYTGMTPKEYRKSLAD